MNILFYDLETTGTSADRHSIHSIAAILVVGGREAGRFTSRVRPYPIHEVVPAAMAISNTPPNQCWGFPNPDLVFGKLKDFLNTHVDYTDREGKIFLAGHNIVHFDNQFLLKFFHLNGDRTFYDRFWKNSFDTLQKAGELWAKKMADIDSLGLESVCRRLNIEFDSTKSHEAQYDAQKAMEVYYTLY